MATAKSGIALRDVVTVVEDIVVTLTLTLEEASALLQVSNRVGGSPIHSPRGRMDSIRQALEQAGVVPTSHAVAQGLVFN
jgi:hypothetical protein